MQTTELYQNLFSYLTERLHILNDKPEETIESCLKVLWVKASGKNRTLENALSEKMVELSKDQVDLLHQLVHIRVSGVPLAYITGRQSFMGIELLCDKRALIPRKETELLGKTALKVIRSVSKTKNIPLVLDVCCGSGNIGLALSVLSPGIQVFSSDLSHDAVNLTKENIAFLNLENRVIVSQGALFEAFESDKFYGKVDVIVCNPPYISSAKVRNMELEISENEPAIAFDGGMLGIKIIQQLIRETPKYLTNGGHLIFEVGLGQGTLISQICEKMNKYASVKTVKDETDHIRVIHCIF
jgi:release factor glutamine methyltransferase